MAAEGEFKLAKDDNEYHPVYVDQHGNEHGAYMEDLYDYLRVQVIGKIADLFLLVGQDEQDVLEPVGSIFRLLIADAEKKLEQVCELLDKNVGKLTIHSLSKGYPWHDDCLPLAVFLKQKAEATTEEGGQS